MPEALVESVPAEVLHREISGLGVTHILTVPDTHQKSLLATLSVDPAFSYHVLSTEDEALCVNAGLWMGGKEPLVVIQNVGLFAAMNALRGVAMDLKVPTCMMVGQYGRDVTAPVPVNNNSAVRLIESVLHTLDVPCYVIDRTEQAGVISQAFAQSREERRPTVILISAPTA